MQALVTAGRPIAQLAADLGASDQTIYGWRKQHLIATGQLPGLNRAEQVELTAANKRIRELETEVAIYASASLNDSAPSQAGAPGCCDRGRGQVDDEGDESGCPAAPGRPAALVSADRPRRDCSTRIRPAPPSGLRRPAAKQGGVFLGDGDRLGPRRARGAQPPTAGSWYRLRRRHPQGHLGAQNPQNWWICRNGRPAPG